METEAGSNGGGCAGGWINPFEHVEATCRECVGIELAAIENRQTVAFETRPELIMLLLSVAGSTE